MTHPDRIFHYTSVETLALILSSRKIRFSRLDRLDDALEGPMIDGIHFNKYFFVSCWTSQSAENIPQWHLYTEKMTGVRIELPSYPFKNKILTTPENWTNCVQEGSMYGPIALDEMFKPSYMLLPMFMSREHFAGSVEYVNDVKQRYRQAVSLDIAQGKLSINRPFDLVRLKNKHWEFQSEYRFALLALPSLTLPPEGPGAPSFYNNLPNHIMRSLTSGTDLGVDFIDLDLNADAFNTLTVTTGPLCNAGVKMCVESLVRQYAPQAHVQASELEGAVRHKL